MVRLRAHGDGAGRDLPGQGADGRLPALGLRGPRRRDGRGLAGLGGRGDAHEHVPWPSRRLRDGAGANPGTPRAPAPAAQRAARRMAAGRAEISNLKFAIANLNARPGPDGRAGITPARWFARDGTFPARHQSHVASRLHPAPRGRARERHQLHPAADHH